METLNDNKIKHIANLAKLNISEQELEKYQKQLSDIMTEINKIVEVKIDEDDIMISPTDNKDCYDEDIVETHISKEEAFKNTKNQKGDYIVVPKVLEGEE